MVYWFCRSILASSLSFLTGLRVQGREWIPDGPMIIVGNHLSFSDSVFLGGAFERRLTFLAKAEYFNRPGLKGRVTAWIFRSLSQVPMDRSGGAASGAALVAGLEVLRAGGIICIYPEGTRSPDGRLYRGRTGVARLAVESGVPVLPVAAIGTDLVQPAGKLLPRLGHRPRLVFGPPMVFDRPQGAADDPETLRSVTDTIMKAVRACSGQEYVDSYSPGPALAQRSSRR